MEFLNKWFKACNYKILWASLYDELFYHANYAVIVIYDIYSNDMHNNRFLAVFHSQMLYTVSKNSSNDNNNYYLFPKLSFFVLFFFFHVLKIKYYTLFLYYTFVVLRWKKNIYNNKADFTFINAGSIIFFFMEMDLFFFLFRCLIALAT